MAQPSKKFFTVEEYLALEDAADYKSEYYNGQIFMMAGASYNHTVINSNLITELNIAFGSSKQPCKALGSDLKVKIEQTNTYTYPDVSVVCGEPKFADNRTDVITNPIAILEVLSPSTQKYDRSGKFQLYQLLDTLQYYVLIDQERVSVTYYQKQTADQWLIHIYRALENKIELAGLEIELPLTAIYSGISLVS